MRFGAGRQYQGETPAARDFALLGAPNFWTIGIMLTSLLIPIAAIFSVVAVWRHRRAPMNR